MIYLASVTEPEVFTAKKESDNSIDNCIETGAVSSVTGDKQA